MNIAAAAEEEAASAKRAEEEATVARRAHEEAVAAKQAQVDIAAAAKEEAASTKLAEEGAAVARAHEEAEREVVAEFALALGTKTKTDTTQQLTFAVRQTKTDRELKALSKAPNALQHSATRASAATLDQRGGSIDSLDFEKLSWELLTCRLKALLGKIFVGNTGTKRTRTLAREGVHAVCSQPAHTVCLRVFLRHVSALCARDLMRQRFGMRAQHPP